MEDVIRGYEAYQNRINRGYEAYQNRINRGYEAYQNRINRGYEAYQNRKKRATMPSFSFKGKKKMLKWVSIPEEYLNYLRDNGDKRIPYSDYGKDKYKPFFGVLFTIGNYAYVTQISHPQERHIAMTEQQDVNYSDLKKSE